MKSLSLFMGVVILGLALPGCGLIYTHTIVPFDLDIEQGTPCDFEAKGNNIKQFQFDIVNLMWDSNAIGDVVREAGLDTVYFADLESFRILGIWNQYTVHVYGR